MSKAFTKDDDGVPPPLPNAAARLPSGTPNYITADGPARLVARLAHLDEAGARALATRLDTTRVLTTPPTSDTIRFGDRVTVRQGETVRRYRIVGIDEVDLDDPTHDHLSWLTPLARTLIGAEAGDTFDDLEVISID